MAVEIVPHGPLGGSGPPVKPPVPVDHGPRPPLPRPSPSARRAAVQAAQAEAAAPANPAKKWEPWLKTTAQAEATLRAEITVALRVFDQAMAAAAQILSTAEALAAEASGQLEDQAWVTWKRLMAEAASAGARILDPAQAAYESATLAAAGEFNAAMKTAEQGYTHSIDAADQARTQAGKFPAA